MLDPVKVFNIYGHNTCGNDSICLAGLWRAAGFKVAPARLVGHCVTQVFYDGSWHLFDGDMHSVYLLRDNETIAGEQDLVRDHDLIRRTHTQGILQPDRRAGDEWESSIYVFEGKVNGDRNSANTVTEHDAASRARRSSGGSAIWSRLSTTARSPNFPNGSAMVCGNITLTSARRHGAGASTIESIRETEGAIAAEDGKTGVVVWTMSSPYVFVGGSLDVDGTGARFKLSWDGNSWHEIDRNLDPLFPPGGHARYRYYLRCELSGEARLRRLLIKNDLQMAPLTLPGMGVGSNTFTYSDESAKARSVRITHEWVERSATRPPDAPRRTGLSTLRRSNRGDRYHVPMAARERSRRRRDCRLSLRALGAPRHELAPLHELREAHLAHRRRGQGSVHAARARPLESRHDVFLARPGKG